MGICPKSFGPYFWAVFHISCLGTKHVANLTSFIHAFKHIIPCGHCRKDFIRLIEETPVPETTDSRDIFYWSVDIHNMVNKKLEKPEMDHETAYKIWIDGCEGETPEKCASCSSKQKKDPLPIEQDFSAFLL